MNQTIKTQWIIATGIALFVAFIQYQNKGREITSTVETISAPESEMREQEKSQENVSDTEKDPVFNIHPIASVYHYEESDLVNSKWKYSDDEKTYALRFMPNGSLVTQNPADKTKGNDYWKVENGVLHFSFNDHYVAYTGHFITHNEVSGEALNKNDLTWKFKLKRE